MTLQNKLDTEEDLKHTTLFISHGRIRPTANVGCWRMNKQYKNTSKILHITKDFKKSSTKVRIFNSNMK